MINNAGNNDKSERRIYSIEESKLPFTLQNKIVKFLTSLPNIHDCTARQALIYSLSLDSQLQSQFDFSKPSTQFFPVLVSTLSRYGTLKDGRNPLVALLESAKDYVGQEGNDYCDLLIQELHPIADVKNPSNKRNPLMWKSVIVIVMAAFISTVISVLIIFFWGTKLIIVAPVSIGIVIISIIITSFSIRKNASKSIIIFVAMLMIVITSGGIVWLLKRQIVIVPSLVNLTPSNAQSVVEDYRLKARLFNATCKGEHEIITFQDASANTYVTKGYTVLVAKGVPIIEITKPDPSSHIEWKATIKGNSCGVVGSNLNFYILIHPLEVDWWWVQAYPITNIDGVWEMTGQFGESRTQGANQNYEIIAIVTTLKLKKGGKFQQLPRHVAHSEVIRVFKE